jgi:hypothetical protein
MTEKERQRLIEAKLEQFIAEGPVKMPDGRVLQLTVQIRCGRREDLSACGGADAVIRAAYMQTAVVDFGTAMGRCRWMKAGASAIASAGLKVE